MKKIGIATAFSVYNYGSKLQAYAMTIICKKYGYEPYIYRYFYCTNSLNTLKYNISKLVNCLPFVRRRSIYKRIKTKYSGHTELFPLLLQRFASFEKFDTKLPIEQRACTQKNVSTLFNKFDALICGSDQIWHPIDSARLEQNLFHDAPVNIPRIAYAPSLGINYIPEEKKDLFKKSLVNFKSISCRESEGAKEISLLIGKCVDVVLDPTMLGGLEYWDNLCDLSIASQYENYIFCYLLGSNPEHRKICKYISEKTGFQIVNLAHFKEFVQADECMPGDKLYAVSPENFLGLIKKAKLVITDSFHCSAFALQYHTQFLTLQRFDNKSSNSTNSRIYTLLNQFGLSDRIIETLTANTLHLATTPIDFSKYDCVIEDKRKLSWEYLNKAFEDL